MLLFNPAGIVGTFAKSELVHLVALFAAVRIWFAREIAAGKAALAEMEAKAKADVSAVESKIKKTL